MNLEEYQVAAMKTAKIMDRPEMLVHGAMGCCTEPGELALTVAAYIDRGTLDLSNVVEELGDGMWFAAYVAHALGTTLHVCPRDSVYVDPKGGTLASMTLRYCAAGSDIGTMVKAHHFYNKILDESQLRWKLALFVGCVRDLCATFGLSFFDVLDANIAKLAKRYPEKYSDAAAVARADKVEDTSLHGLAAHPAEEQ